MEGRVKVLSLKMTQSSPYFINSVDTAREITRQKHRQRDKLENTNYNNGSSSKR